MKTLLAISILILTAGCGHQIDPQLQPYVDSFEKDGGLSVGALVVQFGPLQDAESAASVDTGLCQKKFLSTPTITIDPEQWARQNADQREKTMYHELGHCVLDRGHKTEKDAWNNPSSIMNQGPIDSQIYEIRHAEYLDELFHGGES